MPEILAPALSLKSPPDLETEVLGIHQSDLIIRTAIIKAIADLRANPWLLDYVFSSLRKDDLTKDVYGDRDIAAAKKWFQNTEIPVFMNTRVDEAKLPAISIALQDTSEAEVTLADTHYVVQEQNNQAWPDLTPRFNPRSYNVVTGVMVVPDKIGDAIVLAPGMVILDRDGRAFPITDVTSRYNVTLAPGTAGDFGSAIIKSAKPPMMMQIESVHAQETYSIGVHAGGEQVFLTWLHSIVVFCLYRYKQDLLEKRGYERSKLQSSDFRKNDQFEMEQAWSRYITLTGFVRQSWPKNIDQKITSTTTVLSVEDGAHLPNDTDPDDASWIGDQDSLTALLK